MRKLAQYPNPILATKTYDVKVFDESLHSLLDEMRQIMEQANGIGLAANQVGESLSIFIMKSQTVLGRGEIVEFINPKILDWNGHYQIDEGCLSAPGIYLRIQRFKEIDVQYQDRCGNIKQGILTDIEAICFQHELDHLNGIFFIEKASRNERRAALKTLGLK